MAYVRSHKFCCCLPVRFGVFVMSLAALLFGGIVAVAGWIQVKNLPEHPLSDENKKALYIYSVMFSILALVGGFGFIGVLSKQRGLVSSFGSMLAIHLGFSIGTGIFAIYTLFKTNSDEALANCINGSDDQTVIDSCHDGLKILKIVVVAGFATAWLIELWGCLIVSSYVAQLKEEEMASITSAPMVHYVPPPANGYAFTQPGQAMGVQAA
ncbi:hypothetical protein MSAN_02194900 [Mycena sanguinolenta]|uniref:Tetraspanin n=1 Tax=Mycena sanguinolenta TaxID=230812 RepID=A0A8H7CJX9_9AGAR|nr:hypothetical protein MSAN_02194900 [Mycena sanguinolenta]